MNDPNSLVYYQGEYHLFFQHSPGFTRHAPNSWGHAISTDLVRWQQMETAIAPDEYGWIWSGSAVVDWNDTAGLKEGDGETIVAIYFSFWWTELPWNCLSAAARCRPRSAFCRVRVSIL